MIRLIGGIFLIHAIRVSISRRLCSLLTFGLLSLSLWVNRSRLGSLGLSSLSAPAPRKVITTSAKEFGGDSLLFQMSLGGGGVLYWSPAVDELIKGVDTRRGFPADPTTGFGPTTWGSSAVLFSELIWYEYLGKITFDEVFGSHVGDDSELQKCSKNECQTGSCPQIDGFRWKYTFKWLAITLSNYRNWLVEVSHWCRMPVSSLSEA